MILREHSDIFVLVSKFKRHTANPAFIGMILVAVTLIIFWPVTHFDFINYDDPDYFFSNHHILSGISFSNIHWAFTTGFAGNWHPLTWLSLMLDAQIFGRNSFGPHLTNLLFHAANTVLLFSLLQKLTAATWRSAFIAALFALHPLHVESVAWISERKDVLSMFFGLLTLLAYTRYVQKMENQKQKLESAISDFNSPLLTANYFLVLFLFALALMSKPMMVTLPFVMLLLDWWPLRRIKIKDSTSQIFSRILEKIPFLTLSIASCVVTFIVQQKAGAVASLAKIPITGRIETTFTAYARYLGKALWPTAMANPYPYPSSWNLSLVICSFAMIIGLSIIAILIARRVPFVFVGWFWFVGTLIPVIGLIQVGTQSMADRYTYFPLIGLFIIAAWGGSELRRYLSKSIIVIIAFMTILICALQAKTQLGYWQNTETLFQHALAVTKNNSIACDKLASFYSRQGRMTEAMNYYVQALQINPDDVNVLYDMGNAFAKMGNMNQAIDTYRRALEIKPDQADVLSNLGFALAAKKQYTNAIDCFEKSLKLNADSADTHNNLATVLFINHRFDEAAQQYREAIHLSPDNPQFYANLGDVMVKQGKLAEAVPNYQEALRLNPDDEKVKVKLQALRVHISN